MIAAIARNAGGIRIARKHLAAHRWTSRLLSSISTEDKLRLRQLAEAGDGTELQSQLSRIWSQQREQKPPPMTDGQSASPDAPSPVKVEKILASLYSGMPVEDGGADALRVLACLKQCDNTFHASTLELLEEFLNRDELDLAYMCFQDIDRRGIALDFKAYEMFIRKAAAVCHLPYIVQLLEKHSVTYAALCAIAEPLILSGATRTFAKQFDKYVFESKAPPNPFQFIHVLQEILKAQVRRALSNQQLSQQEMSGMVSIRRTCRSFLQAMDAHMMRVAEGSAEPEVHSSEHLSAPDDRGAHHADSEEGEPQVYHSDDKAEKSLRFPSWYEQYAEHLGKNIESYLLLPINLHRDVLVSFFIREQQFQQQSPPEIMESAFVIPLQMESAVYSPLLGYLAETSKPAVFSSQDYERALAEENIGDMDDDDDDDDDDEEDEDEDDDSDDDSDEDEDAFFDENEDEDEDEEIEESEGRDVQSAEGKEEAGEEAGRGKVAQETQRRKGGGLAWGDDLEAIRPGREGVEVKGLLKILSLDKDGFGFGLDGPDDSDTIELEIDDLTAQLAKRRHRWRLLYLGSAFPDAVAYEKKLVHAVISQVFESWDASIPNLQEQLNQMTGVDGRALTGRESGGFDGDDMDDFSEQDDDFDEFGESYPPKGKGKLGHLSDQVKELDLHVMMTIEGMEEELSALEDGRGASFEKDQWMQNVGLGRGAIIASTAFHDISSEVRRTDPSRILQYARAVFGNPFAEDYVTDSAAFKPNSRWPGATDSSPNEPVRSDN